MAVFVSMFWHDVNHFVLLSSGQHIPRGLNASNSFSSTMRALLFAHLYLRLHRRYYRAL